MNVFLKTLRAPLALTVLATVTLSGQQAPPQTPPQPPQAQTTQRPTFVSQIDLVSLDVIVRDKNGQFVPDLKREDFIVLEKVEVQQWGFSVLLWT